MTNASEKPPEPEAVESSADQGKSPNEGEESETEELVEGGEITLRPEPVSWKERHETETAKFLTYSLVSILAGSILLHYIAVIVLMINDRKDAVEVLSGVFDSWLPVISGFVGGAVTFYLTRRKG